MTLARDQKQELIRIVRPPNLTSMYASKSPVGPPPTMRTGVSIVTASSGPEKLGECSEWGAIVYSISIIY